MNSDETYLKDAANQRAHDAAMAEAKRTFRGQVLIGVAIVAVLLAVIGAIVAGVVHTNDHNVKLERERTTQERLCVDAGNIWINGTTCVPGGGAR